MSYQEKSSVVSIVSNLMVLVFYSFFIKAKIASGLVSDENALKYIAVTMLIVIGASIILRIINLIIFSIITVIITRDESEIEAEDERDKLFGYKSERVSQIIAGVGFLAGLITLAFGLTPVIMVNILFYTFIAGDIVASIVKISMYRKGM